MDVWTAYSRRSCKAGHVIPIRVVSVVFPRICLVFFCAKHTYTLRKQKLYGSSAPLATAVILAKTANLTVQVQKEQICAKWGHSPWSTECHTSSSSIVGITCWLLYDNTKGR